MVLCTLMVGSGNSGLLAACFLSCYFIRSSAMGVSTLPYMDIISKSIEPQRRSRYFSLRQFAGGFFGIFIGFFFIRYILSPESGLVFPTNYAVLFGCAGGATGLALTAFLQIREPIRPVQTARQPFGQHLKQGPHFFRTDRNYRWFFYYRMCTTVAGMCTPFYVPYALQKLEVPDATIGTFLAVVSISGCHLKRAVGLSGGEVWCTIHPQLDLRGWHVQHRWWQFWCNTYHRRGRCPAISWCLSSMGLQRAVRR